MALSLKPSYTEDYPIQDLTTTQFLGLLVITAERFGWQIQHISDRGIIAYTDSGAFASNALITITIEDGIATFKSESTSTALVSTHKKKYVTQFIEAISQNTYEVEELDEKYNELKEHFPAPEDDALTLPPESTQDKFKNFFSIFVPVPGYFVTPIIINLNILIFIIMVLKGVDIISPTSESLIYWGANFRPITLDGQPWRLLTSCFLHIGIFHLLMNMYALLYIGILLEHRLGTARYLTAYLLAGIAASITSLWWHDLTVSAGASGAIFGMYGLFLALLTTNIISKNQRKALLTSIGIFVAYNLMNGVKEGVDNAAHIGGLLSGAIIGFAFVPSLKQQASKQTTNITIAGLTVLLLGCSFFAFKTIPNDIGTYQTKMEQFITFEEEALSLYTLPDKATEEDFLLAVEQKGIANWKNCLQLLYEIEQLNIPDNLQERNKQLIAYCNMRISSYGLLLKKFVEETKAYDDKIIEYNQQIDSIISNLN